MGYCVFILSYGRADKVKTYHELRSEGYTGEIRVVISDDDPQLEEYQARFKDELITFNRNKALEVTKTDMMDQMEDLSGVILARNYLFTLAREQGFTHFLELDDDYVRFEFRFPSGKQLLTQKIKNLDRAFEATFDFLDRSGALTIAWSQGGDLVGGLSGGNYTKKILRKAMNSFFCRVDRPFKFFGRINEDTNMYCYYGSRGKLIMQITDIDVGQTTTQTVEHGMTDLYLDYGTYLKSFYSVMIQPSSVLVKQMGVVNFRWHHQIEWNATVPKILSDQYKKER